MSSIVVHVNEFDKQLTAADYRLMVVCVAYDFKATTLGNEPAPEVFVFGGSVQEVRSFAQAIVAALPQLSPEADGGQGAITDFRAYQGIPDDIDWL